MIGHLELNTLELSNRYSVLAEEEEAPTDWKQMYLQQAEAAADQLLADDEILMDDHEWDEYLQEHEALAAEAENLAVDPWQDSSTDPWRGATIAHMSSCHDHPRLPSSATKYPHMESLRYSGAILFGNPPAAVENSLPAYSGGETAIPRTKAVTTKAETSCFDIDPILPRAIGFTTPPGLAAERQAEIGVQTEPPKTADVATQLGNGDTLLPEPTCFSVGTQTVARATSVAATQTHGRSTTDDCTATYSISDDSAIAECDHEPICAAILMTVGHLPVRVNLLSELNVVDLDLCPCDRPGYECIKVTMDSGAADPVCNPKTFPDAQVVPSPGSEAGQKYIGPSGETIPNEGQLTPTVLLEEGGRGSMTFQAADVRKPLMAISSVNDKGHLALFDLEGSYLIPSDCPEVRQIRELVIKAQRKVRMHRENGVFHMRVWKKAFSRPGR